MLNLLLETWSRSHRGYAIQCHYWIYSLGEYTPSGVETIPMNILQQIIILKDKINKKAHEESAQVACEAAGAIRTVASLTREHDCFEVYSRSLDEPLRESNRRSMYSHALFAASQGMIFFVLALIFWYGGQLVASQELSGFAFFVVLMVRLS